MQSSCQRTRGLRSGQVTFQRLGAMAAAEGLALLGTTTFILGSMEEARLREWQEAGMAADMAYMMRDAAMFTDARRFLPEVMSVIVVGVYYSQRQISECPTGYGRVARYAWGRDYHRVLRKRLDRLAGRISAERGNDITTRSFTDAVPMLERAFARQAGLGFVGKNTMLIRPGQGSYFLLGEILLSVPVTDIPAPSSGGDLKTGGKCGSCTRCLTACPTHAFIEPYRLNAGKCISYHTIESRKGIPLEMRKKMGNWIFGCDICQDVCPFNHRALKEGKDSELNELSERAGHGPFLSLESVLNIRSEEEFQKRFSGTPLIRAKREGLLRNAAVVSGNQRDQRLLKTLEEVLRRESSLLVKEHVEWAVLQIKERW